MSTAQKGKNSTRRSLAGKDRSRKKRQSSVTQEEVPKAPAAPLVQRVFLYIQLNEIQNLPDTPNEYEIHLYHSKNTLQKMSEHYTTETIIYQNEFNLKKPTFTLTVIQDDIEDMNIFSDNPLIISLFERIPRQPRKSTKANKTDSAEVETTRDTINKIGEMTTNVEAIDEGEGEEGLFDESYLKFVSRGYCDLLQVFQHKRFISNVCVFLYPDLGLRYNVPTQTIITSWDMYTILPILKADTFTNLEFITLESLYNLDNELIPNAEDLCVRLSFRSTKPNEEGEHHVVPLCHFYGMYYLNISEQHTCIAWENMKRDLDLRHRRNVGQTQSTATIKLPSIFHKLLYTEGVDFNTKEIDPVEDMAMINNSMHRFVLNEEMCAVLADMVIHNTYQLLVEVFRQEFPETILYDGLINLSVFAYPNVNHMRFACALRQVVETNRFTMSSVVRNVVPFAVIQICFFNPLTEKTIPLDLYNQSQDKKLKLLNCHKFTSTKDKDDPDMIKGLYRHFDEFISAIMLYIIKHKVKSMDDRREYFCCQLANLHNVLMKLCGCDFNVRIPTTNNIEFREMITHMFKELMDRAYDIIMSCDRLCLYHCHYNFDKDRQRTIESFNFYKMMSLLGDDMQITQIYEQLKHGTPNNVVFKFFTFLHDVESGNLRAALDYFKCRVSNRDWAGDYFVALCRIYIKYRLALINPRLTDVAFERLLEQLRDFTSEHFLDSDAFILLHCFYKQCGYLPGMEYTRWHFENLYDVPPKLLNFTPMPIYDFYLTIDPELTIQRSQKFYGAYKLFVQMGLYNFAEQILNEIQAECGAVEKYLMTTVLKLLQKQIDDRFVVNNMQTDRSERGRLLYYYLAHVHGNLEYERQVFDKAQEYFAKLLYIEEEYEAWQPLFRLSFLRLGKLAFEAGNYALAELAYRRCQPSNDASLTFLANYGLGKTLYYMDRLNEAIPEFAKCTNVEIHVPNVWGYLATIHLRLQQNRPALECWKMAKLYPEITIGDDVYDELAKINPSNCDLLVE